MLNLNNRNSKSKHQDSMKKFTMAKSNLVLFIIFSLAGLVLLLMVFDSNDAIMDDNNPEKPSKGTDDASSKEENINFINSSTSLTVPFSFFEKGYLYDSEGLPKTLIHAEQQVFIRRAVQSTAQKISTRISEFEFGLFRLLSAGLEFDLFFKGINESVSRKVNLVQQFSKQSHLKEIPYTNTKDVNIIIPLQGRLDVFRLFLDNLINNVLPTEPNLILTIVYFKDENYNKAKALFNEKLKTAPLFRGSFVLVEDPHFSRGKGIKVGIEHAAKLPFQLIFLCDIDIFIKPRFFKRCRANSIQHHQVYFPIVFSLYNPTVVYGIKQEQIPLIEDQLSVDTNHGFWRNFGYGMACMYRSDYDAAGGIPELQTWGGEDEQLFNRVVSIGTIKPIRSPDTGLFHIYHYKNCEDIGGTTYVSCIRSKAANEGNQMQLGLLLVKFEEGLDIEGALYSWKPVYKEVIMICVALIIFCILVIIHLCTTLKRLKMAKEAIYKSLASA